MLLYCPITNMRKIVVGLVKAALISVDKSQYEIFMLKILQLLPFARKFYTKNYAQYLEILKISIFASQESIEEYKIIKIIIKYLLNNQYKLPKRPIDTEEDIFLGYDHFQINDNEKNDNYFSDGKNASYGHAFELLYKMKNHIPEKYKKLLTQNQSIDELIKTVDNKLSIRYFGKLFANFMSGDQESMRIYMKKLLEFFRDADFFSKAKCYKFFTPFLLKKSKFQDEIIDIFLRYKHKQMKNSKYINEVELFIEYLFNLCRKSTDFQNHLKEQTELVQ